MAEAIVAALIQKIGEVVIGQAAKFVGSMGDVSCQMEDIKRELELMRACLKYADVHNEDQLVCAWARTVREIAFQIEDLVDEYTYISTGGLIMHGGGWKGCIHNTFNGFKIKKRLHDIATRLRNIDNSLCRLSTAKERYQINIPAGGLSSPTSAVDDVGLQIAERAHFMNEDEIVGRDSHKRQLAEWLMEAQPRRSLMVFCGMGGIGKTMLATNAYKSPEVVRHFILRAWVSVHQPCPVNDLLRRIVRELHREKMEAVPQNLYNMDHRDLVQAIQSILEKKRYLIILDDIWEKTIWTQIKHALVDDNLGSRVIITTRNKEVADSVADDGRLLELEPLDEADARRLFYKNAFRKLDSAQCPPDFVVLAQEMVHKCEGMPLALVCIGNLVAQRGQTEEPSMKYILENLTKFLQEYNHLPSEERNDLKTVHVTLDLSISRLPCDLRSCFLYCSIFPRHRAIKRKTLIRLWVAEGFIEERNGSTKENVAERYLNQLVDRCLFHVVTKNSDTRVKTIKIHDLVHDVIVKKSKMEAFYNVYEESSMRRLESEQVRRLSIFERENNQPKRLPQLRSLHVFISTPFSLSGLRFKLLRILNLEDAPLKSLPQDVTCLFNLRFLSIRGTEVSELPDDLGNPKNLEILDAIRSKINEIPKGITKLENLRHLMASTFWVQSSGYGRIRTAVSVPEGIWKLKNLQTLKYVGANSLAGNLGSIKHIRTLHVAVLTKAACSNLCDSISCMSNLLNLRIQALGHDLQENSTTTSSNNTQIQAFGQGCCRIRVADRPSATISNYLRVPGVLHLEKLTSPPLELRKLMLLGKLKNGDLPAWFNSLSNLTHLGLRFSELERDSIKNLMKLPALVNLKLVGACDKVILCIPPGWLPRLKSISFVSMSRLQEIKILGNALQSLENMNLTSCKKLKTLPLGLRNLTNLKKLILDDMPDELVDVIRYYGDEVRHIPYIENWYKKDGIWQKEVVSWNPSPLPDLSQVEFSEQPQEIMREEPQEQINDLIQDIPQPMHDEIRIIPGQRNAEVGEQSLIQIAASTRQQIANITEDIHEQITTITGQ